MNEDFKKQLNKEALRMLNMAERTDRWLPYAVFDIMMTRLLVTAIANHLGIARQVSDEEYEEMRRDFLRDAGYSDQTPDKH
jgi:hypothetical protein